MNYQQSYPGVWLGPVVPRMPVKAEPMSAEEAEAEWIEEQERERESMMEASGMWDDWRRSDG